MPAATRSRSIATGPSVPSNSTTSALAAASISTSVQLVKALRVPQPPANGVAKIEIALEAWESASFFVPKKAELLSQWVLEHLCSSQRSSSSASTPGTPNKGKSKSKAQQHPASQASSSELNHKAWQLLSAIVTTQISTASDLSEAAKRSWLSHLANTQPVLNLAGALARQLNQVQSLSPPERESLLASASVALDKLLPPATSRTAATNVEAATDAIQAWLEFFNRPRSAVEQHTGRTILKSIVTTWTTSLQYGSNAKRNHQHFCNTAVPALLRALYTLSLQKASTDSASSETSSLLQVLEQIAAESLFTEDVQRSLLQAGRSAELTRSASWKDSKVATSGLVHQLASLLQDTQFNHAALSSLTTLSDLLYAKISRSEALNAIASSSNSSTGSVRETQLSLVRKTMLSEWFFPLLPYLLTSSGSQARHAPRAAARRGILQCIERHSLYVMGCDEHEEWRSFFSIMFDSSRNELRHIAIDSTPTAQTEIADHFACLTSLWRLEKSVVEDDLIPIFSMVAAQRVFKPALWQSEVLPASTVAALDFFRAVAMLDIRFRTIPALVHAVLGSLPLAAELVAQTDDATLSTSLFTSQTFLAELGKLCRDSVTPMQVPDLIHRLTSLSQSLDSLLQATVTPRSKKQRTATTSPSNSFSNSSMEGVVALIAQLQVAAQVLQSVQLAPTLRSRSIAAAQELHNSLILPCIDPCLASTQVAPLPATCGVAAAALRVRQALLLEKWRYDPSEPVKMDGSLPTESLTCLEEALDERADSLLELFVLEQPKAELCQLQFQIMQAFLQRAERDAFFDKTASRYCQMLSSDEGGLYQLLEDVSATVQDDGSALSKAWNGCPNRIKDEGEMLQVVWMAVLTRWAPLFDRLAGTKTLDVLADTVVSTSQPSGKGEDVDSGMRYITSTALRNAAFLELPNWRQHVIIHIIDGLTASEDLEERLAATAPLWVAPSEWVTKNFRSTLLGHLLKLDQDLVTARAGKAATSGIWTNWIQLRLLLARVQEEYATEAENKDEELCASLEAFLSVNPGSIAAAETLHAWERASLSALQSIVRVLVARSKHNDLTQTHLVQVAKQIRQEAVAERAKDGRITLKMRAAQDMLAMLGEAAQEFDASAAKFNLDAVKNITAAKLDTVTDAAQTLELALYHLRETRLLLRAETSDHAVHQDLMAALTKHVVGALCVVFSRASALVDASTKPLLRSAADVVLELIRCVDTFGKSTITSTQPAKAFALACCLAYSALIASMPGLQEQRRVADGLQRVVSHLEGEQYDGVLSQLLTVLHSTVAAVAAEAKGAAGIDGDQAALIRTIGLVLGSAPEGTSKIARTHLSQWLAILTSSSGLSVNSGSGGGWMKLRSMVGSVSALDILCSNHAMLFRTQDIGGVLQLFSTITGPSMTDEPSPTLLQLSAAERDAAKTKLFDGIVSTLSSLMRLRQDLVLGFLPQLGSLLARLTTLFRRLRRNDSATSATTATTTPRIEASGLQRRTLRRDLPAWLDPELVSPLTAQTEARTLSRLLSTLVVKNVSLKNRDSTTTSSTKAESLARPFSKHATYILVAYLKSLTSSYSVVPADVRAELEVGMTTICEIIGHHQRDAAMIGLLDSAGKVLLKRVWSEYEKQRYKGQ